jgi:hypothetical protein
VCQVKIVFLSTCRTIFATRLFYTVFDSNIFLIRAPPPPRTGSLRPMLDSHVYQTCLYKNFLSYIIGTTCYGWLGKDMVIFFSNSRP